MKPKLHLIGMLLMCLMFLSSCQKEDQLYSCNENINEYVATKAVEFSSISSKEWSEIGDKEVKIAVFRSFPLQKKSQFIKGHINTVKNLSLWNLEEVAHIDALLEFVDTNNELLEFGWEKNESLKNKFDIFQYKWIEYARENLNWDENTIFLVGFCLDEVEVQNGALVIKPTQLNESVDIKIVKTRSESDRPTCFCHSVFEYCKAGDPYMWFMTCKENHWNCVHTSWGCQLLLFGSCNGICYSIVDDIYIRN